MIGENLAGPLGQVNLFSGPGAFSSEVEMGSRPAPPE
jgi:hypothetical protein